MPENDEMEKWDPIGEQLLGKEKWQSLTYWQKMCEVAAIQQCYKEPFLGSLFGYKNTY